MKTTNMADLLKSERSAADLCGYFDGSGDTRKDYVKAQKRTNKATSRLLALLADLTDPDECSFDHHGGCQAHGYLSLEPGEKCPQREAKEWAAAQLRLDAQQ
jgi:hypothetical protein